ncbi:hypothetical protein GCM10027610_082590 [Dactylosporangium cerinum]
MASEKEFISDNGRTIAGVTVPDTELARATTELARAFTWDLVYPPLPPGVLVRQPAAGRYNRGALWRAGRA